MAMFEAALTDVIAIDADTDTVHFYTAPDNGRKDNHFTANCSCQNFGEEFIEKFASALQSRVSGCVLKEVPPEFTAEAEKLAAEKYRTWEWNYGTNIAYSFTNSMRFSAGRVGVQFNICNNCISGLHFSGDFFGNHPVEELAQMLEGCSLDPEILYARLKEADTAQWIAGVAPEELLLLFR